MSGKEGLGTGTLEERPIPEDAYHLSYEDLEEYERTIVNNLHELGHTQGMVAVVVDGGDSLANFGRTAETYGFKSEGYDFHEGMRPYEAHSSFIYTVDLDSNSIQHIKRIVGPKSHEEQRKTGLTGIEMIDDRLTARDPDEVADLESLLASHNAENVDGFLVVSTNVTRREWIKGLGVKDPVPRSSGPDTGKPPYIFLSYKAVFQEVGARDAEFIICYLNDKAARSLLGKGGMELDSELLGGKEFHLPTSAVDKPYDKDYVAVVLPRNAQNVNAFTNEASDNMFLASTARYDLPMVHLSSHQ